MGEKRLIIDQLKFSYEGVFDLPALYKIIDDFLYEQKYDRMEKLNTEQMLPSGRSIKIETIPFKNITDYFNIHIRIRIYATGLKRVEIEKDGGHLSLQEGKIMLIFDGYVNSDRQQWWEKKPILWFLRVLLDKYIFKGHYMKAEQWLLSDVDDLYQRIKSLFNVYRNYRDRDIISKQVM
jgi:hypothetical protein